MICRFANGTCFYDGTPDTTKVRSGRKIGQRGNNYNAILLPFDDFQWSDFHNKIFIPVNTSTWDYRDIKFNKIMTLKRYLFIFPTLQAHKFEPFHRNTNLFMTWHLEYKRQIQRGITKLNVNRFGWHCRAYGLIHKMHIKFAGKSSNCVDNKA